MTAKILLVDDEPLQRKATRLYLEDAGYAVEDAAGADEALQLARASRPDLIVSDVLMGEVDGFGLCRRVRSDSYLGRVPVVLVSSHYGVADVEVARDVGASTLVERTPTFEAELAAVSRCLVVHRTHNPNTSDQNYEGHLRANANQLTKLNERARRADERFRTLFEEASDAISIISPDGVVLEVNRRWHEILGVTPDEIIGKNISAFAVPGQEDETAAQFRAALAHGGHVTVQLRRPIDGAIVALEFSSRIVDLGGGSEVFTIGRDVTAQVAAMKRLVAAEAMYRSLVERIPDIVWRARPDGTLSFLSANAASITGFSVEQLLRDGRATWVGRIHAEDRTRVEDAFAEALATGAPFEMEYRFLTQAGKTIWLHSRVTANGDGADRVLEGLSGDVTSRRTLEQSLAQAQKLEALGQLTSGIAHDFNNLLAVILSSGSFLLEQLADSDPRRVDAEEITLAADRAAALTRQLLAFSRREAVSLVDVDIDRMVGSLEKMLRRMIGEDIRISTVGSNGCTVRGDVGQLEQVIVNLVVNARDAMPRGGELTISTKRVELAADGITTLPAGSYAQLAVTDTGSGMDAETLDRAFEPFYTTKERGRGTGLGLSTCYGIVRRLGGEISVVSEPGHGTTFTILLPLGASSTDTPTRTVANGLRGSEQILVLEDDPHVRRGLARTLTGLGYRVLTAANGDEAIAIVDRLGATIDLCLSDVVLPGHSGPEVIAQLRGDVPDLRVLWISGHCDHQALRGLVVDECDKLAKPFTPDQLAHRVREILERPRRNPPVKLRDAFIPDRGLRG